MAKPVKCPRCGRENDPSFAFCLDCGQSVRAAAQPSAERSCPNCGAALALEFKFCGRCGTPIPEIQPPAPVAKPIPHGPPSPAPQPRPAARGPAHKPILSARVSGRAATSGPRISLIRQDGQPGAVYSLAGGSLVCGRAGGDAPLPDDPSIAPRHAQFSIQNGRTSVEDLGSVSGTFLRLRAPLPLASGDEIRIGRQLLRLEPFPKAAGLASSSTTWGSPDRGYTQRLTQLLDGGGVGEVYPLKTGENLVGRESGDITFPFDRYVSGRHARIEVKEGRATLSDLGSSNGTFFRISKSTVLQPGDQILIGVQLIRFDA